METNPLLEKFTRQLRIDITYPDMEKECTAHIVRFLRPAPGLSQILYSNLDDLQADAVIREQVDDFAARKLPFSWKVYAYDSPPDLVNLLQLQGFTSDPPDAVMVLEIEKAASSMQVSPQIDVRRIDAGELEDVVKVLEQVWGGSFNWVYQRLGSHLAIPDYLSVYVAYRNSQPACAGWTYYHPNSEFASLWGGGTVQAYRNQGLYTAVLAARVREAAQRGLRYLVTDASPMSQPVLSRRGFFQLTTVTQCEYTGHSPQAF